jgi:hypothetical protein
MNCKFLLGFTLLYGALEGMAGLLGDTLRPENAILTTGAVLLTVQAVTNGLFPQCWPAALASLWVGFARLVGTEDSTSNSYSATNRLSIRRMRDRLSLDDASQMAVDDGGRLYAARHGRRVDLSRLPFWSVAAWRAFWRAAWLAAILFALSHLAILASQGLLMGGMTVTLDVISSTLFARLHEHWSNTICAPAIVHAIVHSVIPMLAAGGIAEDGQQAALVWMEVNMVLP